jgi:hypothetical protein
VAAAMTRKMKIPTEHKKPEQNFGLLFLLKNIVPM